MLLTLGLVSTIILAVAGYDARDPDDYGVDHSFPIHHYLQKHDNPVAYDRYNSMMKTCYDAFSQRECDGTERARLAMNRNQPATQHNYTELGFKKTRAPAAAWQPLIDFYERNKATTKTEVWGRGNTYVNNWETPTKMISFEDTSLRGGISVKNQIWNAVKPVLEEWTGQKLMPTSLYGIRVYGEGSMLSTHVDRLPLVTSCIIQVAQDVDEPWPIEVYSHDGKAYNVTMQPGDMTLYESHTVLHGRPFPLKGNFYANVFVHFKPVNHDAILKQEQEQRALAAAEKKRLANPLNRIYDAFTKKTEQHDAEKVMRHTHKTISGHEQSQHDPDEIAAHGRAVDREMALQRRREAMERLKARRAAADGDDVPGADDDESSSEEEPAVAAAVAVAVDSEDKLHRKLANSAAASSADTAGRDPSFQPRFVSPNVGSDASRSKEGTQDTGVKESEFVSTEEAKQSALRYAAARGDIQVLQELLDETSLHHLQRKDSNDWQLLHEAVRSGQVDAVKLLVSLGADVNSKITRGGTPLWLAKQLLSDANPVVQYLESIGAPDEGSEL